MQASMAGERRAKAANACRPAIETVDVADIPGGGQLHLLKCGKEFSIQFGRDELMGSQDHISEMALATLTSKRLGRKDGHVLVGGLGMGFTLDAVLAAWTADALVTVAELVPQILVWARGPLSHLFKDNLADPRVSVRLGDVYDVIAEASGRFDAILLDVDNGPDGFITPGNDRLYSHAGLGAAYAALRPGGLLSVWSSYADDGFAGRLEESGFEVDEIILPAYVGSTERWHNIWFAAKPCGPARLSQME
ncbi:spermidine synthase [Sphingobium sp.]|uniref:spermidine synthase n=1 Tax=Sphingobium sp. TaxID=1912891 RepID=UPI0035C66885